MSKITVMIPMYNVERYLERCLDSILAQTFQDFEILLIDDGSTDNSGIIGDNYAEKDDRIHIVHKNNEGQAVTRNQCIDWCMKNSDSEWLTFIDSDDWIHKRYLELLLNTAMEYNVEISVCDFVQVSDMIEDKAVDDNDIEKIKTETYFVEYNLNSILPWGKLYKKELFRDIRYPAIKLYEDECTTYKILFQHKYIAFIKFPMYYYFNNAQSVMGRKKDLEFIPENIDFIKGMEERLIYFRKNRFYDALRFQKEEYLYFVYTYCKFVYQSTNEEEKRKYIRYLRKKLRKAIRQNIGHMSSFFQFYCDVYEIAYPLLSIIYWNTVGKLKVRKKKTK